MASIPPPALAAIPAHENNVGGPSLSAAASNAGGNTADFSSNELGRRCPWPHRQTACYLHGRQWRPCRLQPPLLLAGSSSTARPPCVGITAQLQRHLSRGMIPCVPRHCHHHVPPPSPPPSLANCVAWVTSLSECSSAATAPAAEDDGQSTIDLGATALCGQLYSICADGTPPPPSPPTSKSSASYCSGTA